MNKIMKGTTPAVTISVDPDDFLLSNVTKIELYIMNGESVKTYTGDDLVVDTSDNSVTKQFTEEETLGLCPKSYIVIQGRFWFADGNIVGINPISISVANMIEV